MGCHHKPILGLPAVDGRVGASVLSAGAGVAVREVIRPQDSLSVFLLLFQLHDPCCTLTGFRHITCHK